MRVGFSANFNYDTFTSIEAPFKDLLKNTGELNKQAIFEQSEGTYTMQDNYYLPNITTLPSEECFITVCGHR